MIAEVVECLVIKCFSCAKLAPLVGLNFANGTTRRSYFSRKSPRRAPTCIYLDHIRLLSAHIFTFYIFCFFEMHGTGTFAFELS